ncbi:dihydroneopterin aldolase [Weissella minor]|uniref:dihydroneopterin aldolase n=1 Tax=Weissella minor TaxID=1620 RepID=UPI003AF2E40E
MKIKLNSMRFHSFIGFFEAERSVGQDITVTITLDVPSKPFEVYLKDDLSQTINYGVVFDVVANLAEGKHEVKLLETLAAQMIQAIHTQFPNQIDCVTVQIKKYNLPIDGILDNAEIELAG